MTNIMVYDDTAVVLETLAECKDTTVAEIIDSLMEFIDEIDDSFDDESADYTGNMPCDNSGMCAGSSCSNYPKCQGWVK